MNISYISPDFAEPETTAGCFPDGTKGEIERDSRSAQRGTATLIAVLVVALLGTFVAASLSRVTTNAAMMNNDSANSQSFYAAQASLELMSLNFSNIFARKLNPTASDLSNVMNTTPAIAGFTFTQTITALPPIKNATIQNGPFAGLVSIRTPYQLDATATYGVNGQVHLTRSFYNHQIPIFQFGIFYNSDLTMYPGPNMYFSGRVHSNGNIYMLAGSNIYFANRVTAAGEIIRDWNRNGFTAVGPNPTTTGSTGGTTWAGNVFVSDGTLNSGGSPNYQALDLASGSNYYGSAIPASGTSGTAPNLAPGWQPNGSSFSTWLTGTGRAPLFKGNLLANQPALLLPLAVGTGRSNIELIKRGIAASDYQASVLGQATDDSILGPSRYANKPGLRVSLSDSQAELPGGGGGVRLDGNSAGTPTGGDTDANGSRGYQPLAMLDGYQAARINGFRLYTGPNYADNGSAGAGSSIPTNRQTWIKVETVNTATDGSILTNDITKDFLSLGMTDTAPDLLNASLQPIGDSRAILKIQHYEVQGPPVRVADVNVKDQTAPNTTNASVSPALTQDSDSYPTTANYVYNVSGTGPIALGPYNVYTYQPQTGAVLNYAFNYVSMSQNNYTPSMSGDPTSATLNGYSVLTNLHQSASPALYIPSSSLTSTVGNNIWNAPLTPGAGGTTTCPVNVGGFTSTPTYPAGYSMNTTFPASSFQFTFTAGTNNKTFTITLGSLGATGTINYNSNATTLLTNIKNALNTKFGAGNTLVTNPTGLTYNVYVSNPKVAIPGALTLTNLDASITTTPTKAGTTAATNFFGQEFYQFSLTGSNQAFKIAFGGATTGNITYNSTTVNTTILNIKTALAALAPINGVANVNVTGVQASTNCQAFTVQLTFGTANPLTSATSLTIPTFGSLSVFPQATNIPLVAAPSPLNSIEAQALGTYAAVETTTPRLETVVPFPINIFDTREGAFNASMPVSGSNSWDTYYPNGTNDGSSSTWRGANLPVVGVMSVIDIDVANLRNFLSGNYDSLFPNGLTSASIPNNGGWILYVSDRRGDRDDDGEYDMEDIFGPQDGNQDPGEDQNGDGKMEVDTQWESAVILGDNGSLTNNTAGWALTSGGVTAHPTTVSAPSDIAAFFDHSYFRRAVRLINGSQLPGNNNTGFTLATENPAYVEGNYNAQGVFTGPSSGNQPTSPNDFMPGVDHGVTGFIQVPSSIVADSITVLSNYDPNLGKGWQDGNSFRNPYANNSGTGVQLTGQPNGERVAIMTTVRAAFMMGSSIASLEGKGKAPYCQGGNDLCLDGGVHNFPRFLENWGNGNVCPTNVPAGVPTNISSGGTLFNYTGSLINPYPSRQGIGAYKNGGSAFVYSPPVRNWSFDISFLNINQLPPGTPFFQFLQMTGFRETTLQEQ